MNRIVISLLCTLALFLAGCGKADSVSEQSSSGASILTASSATSESMNDFAFYKPDPNDKTLMKVDLEAEGDDELSACRQMQANGTRAASMRAWGSLKAFEGVATCTCEKTQTWYVCKGEGYVKSISTSTQP